MLVLAFKVISPYFPLLPGAWRTATEEWGTEDWNEDVSIPMLFLISAFYP